MASLKLRKNDEVVVIKGKDKGKIGRILSIIHPKKEDKNQNPKLLVKGINIIKRHQKPTQTNQEGGIFSKEAPISIANVAYVAARGKDKVTTSRVGFVFEDNKKLRIIKKLKKIIKE